MLKSLEMILSMEDIKRITEKVSEELVTVDVHGLKVSAARRLLKNIMALNRDGYDICVIHGYSHGTAIKEMVRNDLYNPRLTAKTDVKGNLGRTILKMSKAA